MRLDVHLYLHENRAEQRKLDEIIRLLHLSLAKETEMAGELDALQAQVERNTAVDESAIILLNGLKARLDEAIASGDPSRVVALSAALGASTDTLAAAVAANTMP